MFQRDHANIQKLLLSDPGQEESGTLFGLWTTEGEPVIHIVSEKHSCEDQRDADPADIVGKDIPLSHIGNWRSIRSSELQKDRRQADVLRSSHGKRGRFLKLIISIDRARQRVTLLPYVLIGPLQEYFKPNEERGEIKLLETESPFRHVKGIKAIDVSNQLNEDSDTIEQMEWSTSPIIEGSSHFFKHHNYTYARETLGDRPSDKARYSEGTQQKRTKFSTSYQRSQSGDFKVFVFAEDFMRMKELVREYPHLETGGDLFGLWTTDGDAVIHVVLGPGRNCKRTGASFYQDVPYLQRTGGLLTQDYLLCHIGEWHSHHQLHLFEPSQGDSTTVIRNYPRGTQGFLLIIANIESSGTVRLSPYLYTERSTYRFDKMGTIEPLNTENPFGKITKIKRSIQMGREVKEYSQYSQPERFTRGRQSLSSPRPYGEGSLALPGYSNQAQKRASVRVRGQSARQPWR